MIDNTDWLIKPENYRILQKIRKRIRSIYGTDIRITSSDDVERLLTYRNDKDATLAKMLDELTRRFERAEGRPVTESTSQPGASVKMYRGRVVA